MLNLPPSILNVFLSFAPLFSTPTFSKFIQLATGHILSNGKRTITNCLRCIGLNNEHGYSKFHDVFRRAKWSSFKGSKILFFLIEKEWLQGKTVKIVIDTTLERRRGPRIHGLGIHRDAVRSRKDKKAFSPGHNWLVACVLVQLPGTKTVWSLPFISILLRPKKALASSKNSSDKSRKHHKKFTKYTEQLAFLLRSWLGQDRKIVLTGDSAFCCRIICRACIKNNITFCSGFRLNASLYNSPPPPTGKRGRTRIIGDRLPSPGEIAEDPNTVWETYTISWYGGTKHTLELSTGTALWYHNSTGNPVPIRWVLSRDPDNKSEVSTILSTNQECSSPQIVEYFVERWSIETTFQEVREHLGYETIHTWADKGIEKVSPCIMASYSIICLIASRAMSEKMKKINPISSAWYQKDHITFSDVNAYVKLLIINYNIFPHPSHRRPVRKNIVYQLLQWVMTG